VFWHEQLRMNDNIQGTLEMVTQPFTLSKDMHFWMSGGDVKLYRAAKVPPNLFAV
jgi:hypothetical protein